MSIEEFINIFSIPMIWYAVIVGALISLCAALLGVILVLKHYSLIGHGLADVGFASLSLAMALGLSPLAVSMPIVIAASFVIMAVSQRKGVAGDVAIGIAATGALSAGAIIAAVSKGFNADALNYMFGSILALDETDIWLSLCLSALVIGLFAVFYNRLFLVTCDESFASAGGINISAYQFLISLLTALTVVIGMRMMGTLLISSLIIFPATTARKLVKSFRSMIFTAAAVSVVCFLLGMVVSVLFDFPTGASVVTANIVVLSAVSIWKKLSK